VSLRVEPLADHPAAIPRLARWQHEQWAALNPGDTVEARTARLRRQHRHGIPMTLVAFREDELLGSASLVEQDMPETHPDWTPWLASVFVAPEHRDGGVGSALVEAIAAAARSLGVRKLYLFTPDRERLYRRLGWHALGVEPYRGETVTVMVRTLD
jgi:GNAT superfamily N-acetyltransferase